MMRSPRAIHAASSVRSPSKALSRYLLVCAATGTWARVDVCAKHIWVRLGQPSCETERSFEAG